MESKPYRCPICHGSGRLFSSIPMAPRARPCPACNQTGVVWSPGRGTARGFIQPRYPHPDRDRCPHNPMKYVD